MAQSKRSESTGQVFNDNPWDASPPLSQQRAEASVPSSPSLSSDKENRSAHSRIDKGKGRQAPSMNRGLSDISSSARLNKRKSTDAHDTVDERQNSRRRMGGPVQNSRSRTHSGSGDDDGNDSGIDNDSYNPDQNIEERRRIRAQLRELERELLENRTEFLKSNNSGLRQTLLEADEIANGVKQTGDATIDSRLLVNTADLSLKKVENLTLGNSELGVDVDHFVAKCITFMRRGDASEHSSSRQPAGTQSRNRRAAQHAVDESDEEDGEEGDMLDWAYLGTHACIQHNSRPPVPGFMLGPLSLEKRARKVVQRRANLSHRDLEETRPEVLHSEDIHKEDNNNLTVLCTKIMERLERVSNEAQDAADGEAWEGITDEESKELMRKHGVTEEGALELFRFVVNPKSFGQTVENLFYVSFLIRDGKVGIEVDEDGLPYLKQTEPATREEAVAEGVSKHQAVFAIDMATWEELIEVFDIREPMIEHRVEAVQAPVGPRGWYS